MSYEQLKLENQICFPLYAASRLVTRAYQEDLDKLGITYPQYLVLMILWEHTKLTVNDIADKLILNTNTVTPLLKRMESMELLNRNVSNSDRRKVEVTLTAKGNDMQNKAIEIPANLIRRLAIHMDEKQMSNALELKTKLYELISVLEKI